MFTCSCPTCEAKLVVKDEELVGKILACPKCGGMVFVQIPDSAQTPAAEAISVAKSHKSIVHKKFPDILTNETASGIIQPSREKSIPTDVLLNTIPPSEVSEKEIKFRKILMGVLFSLAFILLAVLGFLMIFQEQELASPFAERVAMPIAGMPPDLFLHDEDNADSVEWNAVEPDVALEHDHAVTSEWVDSPQLFAEPQSDTFEIVWEDSQPNEDDSADETAVLESPQRDRLALFGEAMPGFVDLSVPNIDIEARLALPIYALDINQRSLIGFIRVMSQLSGIPMTLDIDGIKSRGHSAQTLVDGRFNNRTARDILTQTLATLELEWSPVERQISIYPKGSRYPDMNGQSSQTVPVDTAESLIFDVSDLVAGTDDLTVQTIADMIRRLVIPNGEADILPDNRLSLRGNTLHPLKSSFQNRVEITRLLEQLRLIRQLPQQTDWASEKIAPEAFGWDRVMETVTLNYYTPMPLDQIVRQLEEITGLTILVDHHSFHQAFTPLSSIQASVQCDAGTINDAMEWLLASVDSARLAYRIIDENTLEITTDDTARSPQKMSMEVHQYQLLEGETPDDIVMLLRSAVAPESWQSEMSYGGDIVVDVPSGCLLIRQSQPVHRQIRLYMAGTGLLDEGREE